MFDKIKETFTSKDKKESQYIHGSSSDKIDTSKIYRQCDEKIADSCAWAFTNPQNVQPYYYLNPGLAAHEVRIRVMYASLSRTDFYAARSLYGPERYPLCVGSEVVGEVVATGASVERFKVGDKVMYGPNRNYCGNCQNCVAGNTNLCTSLDTMEKDTYGNFWGGLSTHIQQPENCCFKLPSNLELETAAPLINSGVTAYRPLSLHAKKGMRMAVVGAGGVGHLAVQIGKQMGLEVDAFCCDEGCKVKEGLLKELGATRVISWIHADLGSFENTYDLIFYSVPENVPRERLDALLCALKPAGKFILATRPAFQDKLTFSPKLVACKSLQIIPTFNGSVKETQEALDYFNKNKIRPVCEFVSFEEFPKALERLEKGIPLFKIVLRVDDFSRKFKK